MDPYFKKEITYPYKGRTFVFAVAHTLFSTYAIDHGTDMLLRFIELKSPQAILDLGCGYGPIGIILAKMYPQAEVTLVDTDLLAVRYANINIARNTVTNAKALGSVGMEEVADKYFNVIVTNVPAKIGDEAIRQDFIAKPVSRLKPRGELWIVAVSALNRLIPKAGTDQGMSVELIRKRRGHSLYRITNSQRRAEL